MHRAVHFFLAKNGTNQILIERWSLPVRRRFLNSRSDDLRAEFFSSIKLSAHIVLIVVSTPP